MCLTWGNEGVAGHRRHCAVHGVAPAVGAAGHAVSLFKVLRHLLSLASFGAHGGCLSRGLALRSAGGWLAAAWRWLHGQGGELLGLGGSHSLCYCLLSSYGQILYLEGSGESSEEAQASAAFRHGSPRRHQPGGQPLLIAAAASAMGATLGMGHGDKKCPCSPASQTALGQPLLSTAGLGLAGEKGKVPGATQPSPGHPPLLPIPGTHPSPCSPQSPPDGPWRHLAGTRRDSSVGTQASPRLLCSAGLGRRARGSLT